MKQFHIISVGNSLLSNFKNKRKELRNIPFSDEERWGEYIENSSFLEEVYDFLFENPRDNSAELNSLLTFVDGKKEDIQIYLIGTNTASNNICKYAIERYLKENGFTLYIPDEISGYFWESYNYDEKFAQKEFTKNMAILLDKIIYLVRKKQEEGFEVFINPTGGFKPHVVVSALAGFLTGCRVYYIHEEFKEIIEFPLLFYIPKGREIKLLEILSDKTPKSDIEFEKIQEMYEDEMERLKIYGLIHIEEDEYRKGNKIRITERGLLFYDFLKKEV